VTASYYNIVVIGEDMGGGTFQGISIESPAGTEIVYY
jgi:hypothetical protein